MRVLVCGSRTWSNEQVLWNVLRGMKTSCGISVIIEGECPFGGADLHAANWARANGIALLPFPVERDGKGRILGPKRNQQMLEEGDPDVVWAFVDKPLEESRGTADMVRRARAAGIPTYVVQV